MLQLFTFFHSDLILNGLSSLQELDGRKDIAELDTAINPDFNVQLISSIKPLLEVGY